MAVLNQPVTILRRGFAVTCLLLLVLAWGPAAFSEVQVIVESKAVPSLAQDVRIGIRVNNDATLDELILPLEIRSVSGGAFVTSLRMGYADRLESGALTGTALLRRFPDLDSIQGSSCNAQHNDSVYSFSVDGSVESFIESSPEGVLFLRSALGGPANDFLEPGYDVEGSLTLLADFGIEQGTFEIDTTCAAPDFHPRFARSDVEQTISFTKGIITVIETAIDTFHVSVEGNDFTGDGSAEFPFRTIQKAADEAPKNFTATSAVVLVHPGVYKGPVEFPADFGLTVASSDGAAHTHIVGDSTSSVVLMDAGNSTDHHVLDGFTVRDNASPSPTFAGGITVFSPTWASIRNCIVRDNTSLESVAGIKYHGSQGEIINNWIVNNTVLFRQFGSVAALLIDGASAIDVVNNTIANNWALGSSPFGVSGIQIGGVTASSSENDHHSNLLQYPVIPLASGIEAVLTRLDNNIIAFNGPTVAYSAFDPPTGPFYNNLFFGNGNSNNTQGAPFDIETLLLQDPDFLDTTSGNFHLVCTSPAVDAGRAVSVPTDLLHDIDWQSRFGPGGLPVDIGADEYQPPLPVDFTDSLIESNCQHLIAKFTVIDDPGYYGYTWYFGDGDSAIGTPATHEYVSSGLFSVQLRVTTVCEPDSLLKEGLIQVIGPFTAEFDADTREGCDSVNVEFTGTVTAAVDSFIWDFGDGSERETVVVNGVEAPVEHQFTKIGMNTVTLFAINECRTDTVVKADFIEVKRSPNVFFESSFDTMQGPRCNPLTVKFTHTATESLTSLLWDFGDNSTSTEPSPVHTYLAGGHTYSVRLTVTGECGVDSSFKDNYIVVTKRPTATLTVDATDVCAGTTPVTLDADIDGNIISSYWEFGDGDSATGLTVQHTYSVPNDYRPQFIMLHGCGTDTITLPDTLSVGLPPQADFSTSALTGFEPLAVTFSDLSLNDPTSWSWDFGDGGESDLQNPIHTYNAPGAYEPRLAIVNPCGSDTVIFGQPIIVGGFIVSIDSTGVDGDTILYAVDLDTSLLAYDNSVALSAVLTDTPRRGSLSFAFSQQSGIPPFNTVLRAIPSRDLASNTYTIELTADDPARITKTATQSLTFEATQLITVSVDTLNMDSVITFTAASKTITISNTAPALSGLRVVVEAPRIPGSTVFSVSGNGGSIVPQGALRWDVLFSPRVKGTFRTSLRVRSDDPASPDIDIPIVGRGIGEQSPPRLTAATSGELRIDQPITLEFSEAMIPDFSDTFLTVKSKSGADVEGERQWTSNRVVKFVPDGFLPDDDTLSVLLRAVISDTNGNYFDGNRNGVEEGSPKDDTLFSIPTGPGVYPGDANNDGTVSEGDVIALGRYYGLSGDPRPAGPSGFALQPAIAWSIRAATYADADGSGDVDSMDICLVSEFFNMEAPLPKAVIENWLNSAQGLSGDVLTSLRGGLINCPMTGPGQEILLRFLDELGGGPTVPVTFELDQNYPNPFNPSTLIRYDLPEASQVRLEVFDITGRAVRTLYEGFREAGTHNAVWDGRDGHERTVASGIYFYRLMTPKFQKTRKMVLLK